MIQNNLTPIVIVLGAMVVIAIALIVYLFLRLRRVESEYDLLTRDAEGKNFVEIVNDNIEQVENLLEEVDGLSERYAWVLKRMAGAVQHVGVVRFDAFRDLGGLLSFAVALLDDRGNGLILSSIYGRSESRTYAKPIVERGSKYELSPEEQEAIRLAMQSKEMGALPVEAKDRDHVEKMANLRLFHDKEFLEVSQSEAASRRPRQQDASIHRPERRAAQARPQAREKEAAAASRTERPRQVQEKPVDRSKGKGRVSHIRPVERPQAPKEKQRPDRRDSDMEDRSESRRGAAPGRKQEAGRRGRPAAERSDDRGSKGPKRQGGPVGGERPKKEPVTRRDRRNQGERPASGREDIGTKRAEKERPEKPDIRHPADARKRSRRRNPDASPPGLDTPTERLRGKEPNGE
jgi:hypothetical protein